MKNLVLCADSSSGKSNFAEGRFDSPYVLTVEGAEHLDLRGFDYEKNDGVVLDNVNSWKQLLGWRAVLQARNAKSKGGQSATNIHAYPQYLHGVMSPTLDAWPFAKRAIICLPLLALLPAWFGLPGYLAGIVVLTPGYQLFQAANNTQIMSAVPADRRGVTSGMLGLARNLGLVTGAAVMGAVFAAAAGGDVAIAGADAVARGLRITFATAAALMLAGIVVALLGRMMAGRRASALRSRQDRS